MPATNMDAALRIKYRIDFALKQMKAAEKDEWAARERKMAWCRKINELESELTRIQTSGAA